MSAVRGFGCGWQGARVRLQTRAFYRCGSYRPTLLFRAARRIGKDYKPNFSVRYPNSSHLRYRPTKFCRDTFSKGSSASAMQRLQESVAREKQMREQAITIRLSLLETRTQCPGISIPLHRVRVLPLAEEVRGTFVFKHHWPSLRNCGSGVVCWCWCWCRHLFQFHRGFGSHFRALETPGTAFQQDGKRRKR